MLTVKGLPVRVLVVSQAWPETQRTGVPLAAAMHVRMLAEAGCKVDIMGSHASIIREDLPAEQRFHVRSLGSGALYAPARVDRQALASALAASRPDVVVIEAWQTALTDAAVDVAHAAGIAVLMISHGVSVHPFTRSWTDLMRAWAWWVYRRYRLPSLVRKLSLLTTLDGYSRSDRFFDRDLARRLGVPVKTVANAPVHFARLFNPRVARQRKVLCVGYFSRIKNQLAAIDLLEHLPSDVILHFIGPKTGAYFAQCVERVTHSGWQERVVFSDDIECDVADEMARSMVVLSTSITEALPLVLLEAMASGTPFVATPVGAVTGLGCGLVANTAHDIAALVCSLLDEEPLWERHSRAGVECYTGKYSLDCVRQSLMDALCSVLSGRGLADSVPQEFLID